MYINTKGLVLREAQYKESSKILTVLTPDNGKLTVTAKGVKRKNSKLAPSAQLLAFSDMTLSERNGFWTLTEAQSISLFEGLRCELSLLALGSYFAQVLETLASENIAEPELLSLGLNSLYALSELGKKPETVKAVFELRAACIAGFSPLADRCSICGRPDIRYPRFDIQGGSVRCRDCHDGSTSEKAQLCDGSLDALRHIISCDAQKMFSFSLGDAAMAQLSAAAEKYLVCQLDRGFKTLDYYKTIC